MTDSAGSERIVLQPGPRRVLVRFAGQVVADSANAITLHERGHDPVHYLPMEDVDRAMLEDSDRSTHCPYKGDARYWSIRCAGGFSRDALWSYENPLPDVTAIQGHVAFYPDRVESISIED